MTDPFREFNDGVQRAMDAYWRATSPHAAEERAARKREKNRQYRASMRVGKAKRRGRAA